MNRYRHLFTACLVFALLAAPGLRLMAQEWVVPADKKSETAPFKFTDDIRAKGAAVFTKNCQQCHGNPGKANWANIQPQPGDPASEKFRKDSDGDLFYKISTGRGPMPQFMNILSEEDRWDVIAYIRSFHPGYVQPNPELALAAAKGGRSTITMRYDTARHALRLLVTNKKGNVVAPAGKAGINIFVHRYFGMLEVGSTKTNDIGTAYFSFHDSLPGDELGRLIVTARLDENSGYGSAETMDTLAVGKPTHWVSLTDPRAMWNVRAKAPLWLVLMYSFGVIGVFSTLFYIVFRIRRIYILGKSAE